MRFVLFVALVGCVAGDDVASDPIEEELVPAELTEPSGDCAELAASGSWTMTSSGIERTGLVYLPAEPEPGMGLLYAWHGLGVTGSQIAGWMDADELAEAHNVAVIVPSAMASEPFEWQFLNEDATDDLILFDDLRTCMAEQFDELDLARVYSNGMSAGGLWTTFLSLRRADSLAAISVMSGGTEPLVYYQTPSYAFPAQLMWGGETDSWGTGMSTVDFNETMVAFRDELLADEHTVVECVHDLGHSVPSDGFDAMAAFLFPHVFGETSPHADGDLRELPAWCAVPAL
jgi:predicted esterase